MFANLEIPKRNERSAVANSPFHGKSRSRQIFDVPVKKFDGIQRKFQTRGHHDSSFQLVQKKESKGSLSGNLRSGLENLSGYSMDDVQVHYNSPKPAQLYALAYTQGTDIYLGPGQEKHLGHEAWHVAQQKQGRVKANTQFKGIAGNDDQQLENEADQIGARLMRGHFQQSNINHNLGTASLPIVQRLKASKELNRNSTVNIVGEDHYESKDRRDKEKEYVWDVLGSDFDYEEENTYKTDVSMFEGDEPINEQVDPVIFTVFQRLAFLNYHLESVCLAAENPTKEKEELAEYKKVLNTIEQSVPEVRKMYQSVEEESLFTHVSRKLSELREATIYDRDIGFGIFEDQVKQAKSVIEEAWKNMNIFLKEIKHSTIEYPEQGPGNAKKAVHKISKIRSKRMYTYARDYEKKTVYKVGEQHVIDILDLTRGIETDNITLVHKEDFNQLLKQYFAKREK